MNAASLDELLDAVRRVEVLLTLNGRPRVLLPRTGAAEAMGVSLAHFERHVAPHVPFVQVGTRILYRPQDLEAFADQHVHQPAKSARRS